MSFPCCRCPEFAAAEKAGAFVRAPAVGGWVDLSADKAIRRNGYGYVWTNCPWCRGDLPPVPLQMPNGDTWTAHWGDGDE